jgi:CRP-like cAMP-binding protein
MNSLDLSTSVIYMTNLWTVRTLYQQHHQPLLVTSTTTAARRLLYFLPQMTAHYGLTSHDVSNAPQVLRRPTQQQLAPRLLPPTPAPPSTPE